MSDEDNPSGLTPSRVGEAKVHRPGSPGADTARTIPEIIESEERLHQKAHTDPLTGLPNILAIQTYLESAFGLSTSPEASDIQNEKGFLIIFMDLDKFKSVNDTLGHAAGDGVLKQFSERLKGCVRQKVDDTKKTKKRHYGDATQDMAFRYGGEEFGIILPMDKPSPKTLKALAKRIFKAVSQAYDLGNGITWNVSVSMGIQFISHEEMENKVQQMPQDLSAEQLGVELKKDFFKKVDKYAYDAKENGRARAYYDGKPIFVSQGPFSEPVLEARREAQKLYGTMAEPPL